MVRADPNILETRSIQKWFGGTHALRGVSLSVRAGEVHAIVGENGAGKSTLVKIIAGVIPSGSFEGMLVLAGEPCSFKTIREAEAAGIFFVPQELIVVPETSVAENLFLNREPRRGAAIDYKALWTATNEWIEALRIGVQPTTPMQRLSAGQQQLISVARAMSRGVRILILDEPTSSLTQAETELLFEHVAKFHERGVTTLYISHRLAEITQIADRVTVMRDGRIVDQLDTRHAATTPRSIARAMVGRDIEHLYPTRNAEIGEVVLAVQGLRVESYQRNLPPAVVDFDLTVRRGEIVGIFGAIGSGVSEIARALFGALPRRTSGTVAVVGREVRLRSPRDAIRAGLGCLTADRKVSGLVLPMSIAGNLSLVVLRSLSNHQVINRCAELSLAADSVKTLRIHAASLEQPVVQLSGGNQQKVVAGKWLAANPKVMILEEPTRGIDVGARGEMYSVINELAEQGKGILILSSDLSEVIGLSDRVIAICKGRIAGEWTKSEVKQNEVLESATQEAEKDEALGSNESRERHA